MSVRNRTLLPLTLADGSVLPPRPLESELSPHLRAYLGLEKALIALDDIDEPRAAQIRSVMDLLWHKLTDAEHAWLDQRDNL